MARRFQFRLEPVLRQRKRVEEDVLRDFASAQAKVLEQEGTLESIADDKSQLQDEIIQMYSAKENFQQVVERHRFINILNMRAHYGSRELDKRREALEQERERLLDARKNRRALEILRERREEEHRLHEDAEEAKMIDELSVQRFRVDKNEEERREKPATGDDAAGR